MFLDRQPVQQFSLNTNLFHRRPRPRRSAGPSSRPDMYMCSHYPGRCTCRRSDTGSRDTRLGSPRSSRLQSVEWRAFVVIIVTAIIDNWVGWEGMLAVNFNNQQANLNGISL